MTGGVICQVKDILILYVDAFLLVKQTSKFETNINLIETLG